MYVSLLDYTMANWTAVFSLILLAFSFANGRTLSIDIQQSMGCINESYVIPLFSTRIIHMTFNQTRLKQLNIHTVHLRTSIADRKVAEFYGHHPTIKKSFRIIDTSERKDKCKSSSIMILHF